MNEPRAPRQVLADLRKSNLAYAGSQAIADHDVERFERCLHEFINIDAGSGVPGSGAIVPRVRSCLGIAPDPVSDEVRYELAARQIEDAAESAKECLEGLER